MMPRATGLEVERRTYMLRSWLPHGTRVSVALHAPCHSFWCGRDPIATDFVALRNASSLTPGFSSDLSKAKVGTKSIDEEWVRSSPKRRSPIEEQTLQVRDALIFQYLTDSSNHLRGCCTLSLGSAMQHAHRLLQGYERDHGLH